MKISAIAEELDEDADITPMYRTQYVGGEPPYREYMIPITRNQFRKLLGQELVPEEQDGELVEVTEENFSKEEVERHDPIINHNKKIDEDNEN